MIQRYYLYDDASVRIDEDGDYVLYADHLAALEEALRMEKTHSATSDFCSNEWKNDADELRDLVKSALIIISEELMEPYSREDQLRIQSWIADAQDALGKEAQK
jgi:hypothetical protein